MNWQGFYSELGRLVVYGIVIIGLAACGCLALQVLAVALTGNGG